MAVMLIVVGPKELPGIVRGFREFMTKMRRSYNQFLGSVTQLEREIVNSEGGPVTQSWQDLIPDEIKELRASIQPHSGDPEETARKYKMYKAAVRKAQQDFIALQEQQNQDSPSA